MFAVVNPSVLLTMGHSHISMYLLSIKWYMWFDLNFIQLDLHQIMFTAR